MCGIAAMLSFKDKSLLNQHTLKNMANEIRHRGPDDEGFYLNEWVGFGFRRLSILDISHNGHQPMFDASNNYVTVFNGEIYNYKTLREELIKKKYKFISKTDTEVLLNAYIEWGCSCLYKLEGMFAFIIYDKIKDEVIVARDHLGIKPLYYCINNNYFLFGSEIKSFRNLIKFELNEKQLYEQFVYGYVSGKNTIFKDIYRVGAGTYLKFNKKGFISENLYYNVTNNLQRSSNLIINAEDIKKDINESILKHTMSDVGFNIQLSGGIDSSYITAVLSKEYEQNLNTYSVKLENYQKDESKYQKIVSEKYNTNHHSLSLGGSDLRDNYEKATWHHDIPLVHPASTFLMLICQHSRKSSKVILTGEGSDELFGGYNSFKSLNLYKYQLAYFLQKFKLINLIPGISKLKEIKKSLKIYEPGIDEVAIFSQKVKLLSLFNQFSKNIDFRESIVSNLEQMPDKIFATFQTNVLSYLLERQDKISMAMSVEARVPYCNYLLFDKINNISYKEKIKPVPKTILKKFAEQYFDKSFVYRKKNGFGLPLNKWLRDERGIKSWFDLLTDKTFKERGFYNSKNINPLIDKHLLGNEDNSKLLFNIINFEIWHRVFIDQ
jgi:asparagine synthase (glutamine-hydrolysing)